MTVLLSGGAKNGKSGLAQEIALALANGGKHYYVATMIPCDEEDYARIRRHLAEREGMGFETLECGTDILSCLEKGDPKGTFLLDSVTALFLNELYPDHTTWEPDETAAKRCAEELCKLTASVGNAVFVSDAIYADAAHYDDFTELYRKGLALIDCALASVCDTVIELSAGNRIVHKGRWPL